MYGIPCPQKLMLSADVYLYLLKLQKEEVGEKRNGKEAEQAIFLSGGAHPMAMARQPITYAFDMLATSLFPSPAGKLFCCPLKGGWLQGSGHRQRALG